MALLEDLDPARDGSDQVEARLRAAVQLVGVAGARRRELLEAWGQLGDPASRRASAALELLEAGAEGGLLGPRLGGALEELLRRRAAAGRGSGGEATLAGDGRAGPP